MLKLQFSNFNIAS